MKNKQYLLVRILLTILIVGLRKNAYAQVMYHKGSSSHTSVTTGTNSGVHNHHGMSSSSGIAQQHTGVSLSTHHAIPSPTSQRGLGTSPSGGLGGSAISPPTTLSTGPVTAPTTLSTPPTSASGSASGGGLPLHTTSYTPIQIMGNSKNAPNYPLHTINPSIFGRVSNTPSNVHKANIHKTFPLHNPLNKPLNKPFNKETIHQVSLVNSPLTTDNKLPISPIEKPMAYTFNNSMTDLIWNNILQNDSQGFYDVSADTENFCILCIHSEINYINSKTIGKLIYLNSYVGMKYNIYNDDYVSLFISVPTIKILDKNIKTKQSNIISGIMYKHEISPYDLSFHVGYAFQQFLDNTLTHHTQAKENGLLLSAKINRKFSSHDDDSRMANLGFILSNHIFYGQANTNDSYYLYKGYMGSDVGELYGYLDLKKSYKFNNIILTPNIIFSANISYDYTKNSYNFTTPNPNPNATDLQTDYILRNNSFDIHGEITTSIHMQIHDKYNLNLGLSAGHSLHMKNLRIYVGISI